MIRYSVDMFGRLLGGLVLLASACSASNTAPRLDRVSPDYVLVGQERTITLYGENIYQDVSVDLSGGSRATINDRFAVGIGEVEPTSDRVEWLDESRVRVTTPATLALGTYDITLRPPRGQELTLLGALHVVDVLPDLDAGVPFPGDASTDAGAAANKTGSFSDDFSDSMIGLEWFASESLSGCTVNEVGSRIQFIMDGTSASRCLMTTMSSYDLRDSFALIDIPPITNFRTEMYVFLMVIDQQGDRVEFGFHDNLFYTNIIEAMVQTFSDTSAYLPTPGYWKIRESGGQLFLESSINQVDWEIEFQFPVPFPVSQVRVAFGVETTGPMGTSIGISVPGYNTLP